MKTYKIYHFFQLLKRWLIKIHEVATFNNVKIICYYIVISIIGNFLVNTIQDGREQKGFPNSSSPVTSTNIGISPQNFLTFSFNPFAPLL